MNDQNYLVITNPFTDIDLDSQISLKISDIVNPYSLSSLDRFEFYLHSRFGGIIAQQTNGKLTPKQPSKPRFAKIESSVKTLNQFTNLSCQIEPLSFFNPNDTIEITFPAILNINSFGILFQTKF